MIYILENKKINECNEDEKKQVFNFAFGEKFMESNDKGTLKEYEILEGYCDICGVEGEINEKLDTNSMNYYNHCNKKECIEYKENIID